MSEGLHDLELLIASFPRYKEWFLANAFGQRGSFAEFSTTRFPLRGSDVRVKWLVIHSPGDTLVDILQSQLIYKHLCQLHKDAGMEVERQVTANMEELTEDHNDILRGEAFVRIVAEYVLADAHRERI
jgi:hypothetical protein